MCFIIFLFSVIISFSSASLPSFLLSSAVGFPYLSSSVSLPLPFPFGASRMADLAPDIRILALYSSEAGELWHERIILSRAYDSHFSMIGPDLIVYSGCVGGTQDIWECFLVPADGSRPQGMPDGAWIYGFTDFTDFSGVAGAQLIRYGIGNAQVYPGLHRPDLGPDDSESLAEAAAVRAESGVGHLEGTFGVTAVARPEPARGRVVRPLPMPAGTPARGEQYGEGLPPVTIGDLGAVKGEE